VVIKKSSVENSQLSSGVPSEQSVESSALRRYVREEMAVAAENWIESSGVDSWQMMEESGEFS
jgi:hypothetical protein